MRLRIRASVRFPMEGPDWPRKLLIGGATGLLLELVFVGIAYLLSEEAAFGIAPLAVIVNLPVVGYLLAVYEGTLRSEAASLPEWEDWPRLFFGGFVGFGIALAYGLAPLVLVLFGLGLLVKGGIILFLGMVLMVLGVLAGVFTLFFLRWPWPGIWRTDAWRRPSIPACFGRESTAFWRSTWRRMYFVWD